MEAASRLEAFLGARAVHAWLDRAVVLTECGSTQDEALRLSGAKPGLVVGALGQTGGRGRLGRTWVQRPGLGLALTFVLDPQRHDAPSLSMRVGCAVCAACEQVTGLGPVDDLPSRLLIKWPNDVVASFHPSWRGEPYRKLAGVLVERRDGLLLVGVGINVLHEESDWPANLRERAASLKQVPGAQPASVQGVAEQLLLAMDRWLFADGREFRRFFSARDALIGTVQTVEHNAKRYSGTIEAIDPGVAVTLRTNGGIVHTLPALTSSLVKD